MIRKLSHVGQIVENMDEALALYKDLLGLEPWEFGVLDLKSSNDGAKSALLPIGNNFFELIEPTNPTGFLAQALKQKGEGLFHVAFLIDDFDAEIGRLQEKQCALMQQTFNLGGFEQRVAFILPSQTKGTLIELIDMTRLPPGFAR